MEFFKKYIILFTIIFTFGANAASNINPYTTPSSCMHVVDAGKRLALDDTSGFNSTNTLQDFVSCNLEILPSSLSTDIMYSIFGKSVLVPLNEINSFIKSIYTNGDSISVPDIDIIDLEQELDAKITTFPVLIATIEALTFASFQLISFMLGAFSLFYLVNTMTEGTYLGKESNTFWTVIKMSSVMGLIFPLDGLGLNIVQLVIIFIAFCGSFLASLIWSILPLFKYAYLNDFTSVADDLKIAKNASTIEITENLVKSSVCDISARQATLLNGIAVEDYTSEMLNSNKMFSCLKNSTPSNIVLDDRYSFEHNKTINCAKEIGTEYDVGCGFVTFGENHTDTLKSKFRDEFYPLARAIAKKTIAANCAEKEELKIGDPSTYFTYCSDLDNISFNSDYKGNAILSTISSSGYDVTNYKQDLLSLQVSIEAALTTNLTEAIVDNEVVSDEIDRKISFALNKGWFNAGTFLFDVGDTTSIKDNEYESVMTSVGFERISPLSKFQDDANRDSYIYNSRDSSSSRYKYQTLEEQYKSYLIKGQIEAIRSKDDKVDIYSINKDIATIGLEYKYKAYDDVVLNYIDNLTAEIQNDGVSKINGLLFPTLLIGREFNEPEINGEDSCTKDYNNCKKMPINPIATIIDTSRSSAASTGVMIVIIEFIQMGITYADNKSQMLNAQNKPALNKSASMMFGRSASLILSFMSFFLTINMLISILAGYILPIVLFIYFIGNALSWVISLVLSVVGATLWMGLHLMPSKDTGFAGHAKKGYLMIMDVFLKPVFIVLGVFGAFILSTILIVVFNSTFEIVMSTFSFFSAPKSVLELFYNFLINIIYVSFLIIIFFRSAKAVYKIPNALENWIGLLAYEDAGMLKEVTHLIQKTFLSNIKRFLIFS